jgi:hypothetical protein
MPKGGKRPGAGRKVGSKSKTTIERELKAAALARNAADQGVTPLDVMLDTMRDLFNQGRKQDASAVAKDAAPYVHAKLAAVEVDLSGEVGLTAQDDDQIDARLADLLGKAGIGGAAGGKGKA